MNTYRYSKAVCLILFVGLLYFRFVAYGNGETENSGLSLFLFHVIPCFCNQKDTFCIGLKNMKITVDFIDSNCEVEQAK